MNVFEKSNIAGVSLPNRIIRSATHEALGDSAGHALPELEKLYERLAEAETGAIITGYVGVSSDAAMLSNMRMFHTDDYIKDYDFIQSFKEKYKTPIILQLAHCGGKSRSEVTGVRPISPSGGRSGDYTEDSRSMDNNDIERVILDFAYAAQRAQKAGFDGVQIHAAHGYLLSQFLSPRHNRRTDKWGGSTENRFRIIGRIIEKTRDLVERFPIWIKISASDSNKGGMRTDEALKVVALLQEAGIDAIEVSGGDGGGFDTVRVPRVPIEAAFKLLPWYEAKPQWQRPLIKLLAPLVVKHPKPIENYRLEEARQIKAKTTVPIIATNGIKNMKSIKMILDSGIADYVSLCRPFIIEPDIVAKFRDGKSSKSKCIDCGFCLMGVTNAPLRCYAGRVK